MVGEDFESLMSRGQALLETLFPGVLVVDGESLVCCNSGVRRGTEYEEGGQVEGGTRQVRVAKELLAVAPTIGDALVLDGVDVRCVGVSEREWDVAWHLELEPLRA